MCGRINVHDHPAVQAFLEDFGLSVDRARFVPRYNVAPTDPLHAVIAPDGAPEVAEMSWGLPHGAKGLLINARAETVWQRPTFRDLVRTRRAVLPINGFYEWRREGSQRLPYHFTLRESPVLPLASIYTIDETGQLRLCVITTEANAETRTVHDRMPVILTPAGARGWLADSPRETLSALLRPAADGALRLERVSTFVNNARHDGPECIAPQAA